MNPGVLRGRMENNPSEWRSLTSMRIYKIHCTHNSKYEENEIPLLCYLSLLKYTIEFSTLSSRNLVDSASSHMLVSRIKPCKPKSNWDNRRSANGSLYQKLSTGKIAVRTASMDNFAKREANTCTARDVLHQTALGKPFAGRMSREWLTQGLTPEMAVSQRDESNHSAEACFGARVPTNFCPISFWR